MKGLSFRATGRLPADGHFVVKPRTNTRTDTHLAFLHAFVPRGDIAAAVRLSAITMRSRKS
jgi:hypothetical protein